MLRQVLRTLESGEALDATEIARRVGSKTDVVLMMLTTLERQGRVRRWSTGAQCKQGCGGCEGEVELFALSMRTTSTDATKN